MENFLIFGHRGAAGLAPENTLLSVQTALQLGVDGVEIDVYCVEGQLVVIHDDTLERTTNGHGRVMDKTLDYLRSLDAGSGERIPLLQEVLDLVDRRAIVNIELKGPDTAEPVVNLIRQYVSDRGWNYKDFLVSSFDHVALDEVHRFEVEIQIGFLLNKPTPVTAREFRLRGAYSIHPRINVVDVAMIADAHAHDMKIFVYTVNVTKDIDKLKELGVDGVFTDYPDRASR